MTNTYRPRYLTPESNEVQDQQCESICHKNHIRKTAPSGRKEIAAEPVEATEPATLNRLPAHVKQALTVAAYAGAFLLGFLLAAVL